MSEILLKYGDGSITFTYDEGAFQVLAAQGELSALTDLEISEKLDQPIDSDLIESIVKPGESVLFVVPDATRQTGCGQIINLLVRRLIANGTEPSHIRAIFATGIHRPATDEEKRDILTPFIAQRVKTLDHNARDLASIVRLGETSGGIPVELNRALTEHDHIILLGGITFHYFAGFTGGRKLICPGLASARTISATHKLAFDCEKFDRRQGVGTGLLDGNAVHESFVEAASHVKTSFAVNTIVNDAGDVVDLFCGDWLSAHRAACDLYESLNSIAIDEKRGVVVVSCGGFPFDINMIQAHKALEAASHACIDGGTIVLLAECREGMGRADFLDWFDAASSGELARRLCEKYQVNGQTAWNLLRIAERFDVRIVTALAEPDAMRLRCKKETEIAQFGNGATGYILPNGAKFRVRLNASSK